MKRSCTFVAILAIVLSTAAISGERGEREAPDKNAPPDAAEQRNREALQRKREAEEAQRDQQRVREALQRRREMEEAQRGGGEARQAGREGQMGQMQSMPRLSVRQANGTEIQADAPLLMAPGVGQQVLDRALDPASDGLLAYRLGRDLPQGADLERIRALLAQTVPGAKIALEPELKVLVVTADKPEELRRVVALMRAFRPEQGPQPFGPREPRDAFARRERAQPEEQPVKPPQEPPGQF